MRSPKCPYFNIACIRENCLAYKKKKNLIKRKNWFPYCKALGIKLTKEERDL